jgi:predicted neuraminidase
MKELDYSEIHGIAITRKGRQFISWKGGEDGPGAFFVLAYSDNGKTWNEPCMVVDLHDDELPCDISIEQGMIWIDPKGRLFTFFSQSFELYDGRESTWFIRCDDPDADTLVWTEPQYIWHGCVITKPAVLSSGEWMLPLELAKRERISPEFKNFFHEFDDMRMSHVFVSRDEGVSWTRRGGVVVPDTDWEEPMVVELKDGRLWMLIRTSWHLMESFSLDSGTTWTQPKIARVQSTNSRFYLGRLRSGRILLVKHGAKAESAPPKHDRSWLTAFLSEDEGETWKGGLVLDERPHISYPDVDQDEKGVIHIVYDHCRAGLGEILKAQVTEEDILNGKPCCPGSSMREVIIKPGKQFIKGRY